MGRARFRCFPTPATAGALVLSLDIADLDRANRRARTIGKGGKADDLLYDIRTARMLGQLLGRRHAGPGVPVHPPRTRGHRAPASSTPRADGWG